MAVVEILEEKTGFRTDLLPGSQKKRSQEPAPTTESPEEQAKAAKKRSKLRTLGYIFIATIAIFFFYLLKLPADIIGRDALALLSQNSPYEWKAEKSSLSFILGPKLIFEKVQLIHRFPPMGSSPQRILLDRVAIAPSLFQMPPIPGLRPFTPAGSFSLEAFQGTLSGNFKMGTSMSFSLEGENLNLEKMDFLKKEVKNLKGTISSLKLQLEAPQSRFAASNGFFDLQAKSFELDPSNLTQGMPVPNLNVGPVLIHAVIKSGRLTLDRLTAGDTAKDISILGDGQVQLKDPLDYSELDLRLQIKLSDNYAKLAPALNGMIPIIGAKRSDGYFGTKITGPLMAPSMPTPYTGN